MHTIPRALRPKWQLFGIFEQLTRVVVAKNATTT